MAVTQPVIPQWVAPTGFEVKDALTVTEHGNDYTRGAHDALAWITQHPTSADDAGQRMTEALGLRADRHQQGIADALAWLLGITGPPVELPRRNPDGTLVDWRQLYTERRNATQLTWEPEQAEAEEARARRTAARWEHLAGL